MHKLFYKIFYYIDRIDKSHLEKLDKKIHLIFRNYEITPKKNDLKELRIITKKKGIKLYLAQDHKLAISLGFDGVYLPSFNNLLIKKNTNKKNFLVLGSAHNMQELKIKEKQGVDYVFISPIFNTKNKRGMGITRFNQLLNTTSLKIIALGGINELNLKKLPSTKIDGFASINYIKKKYAS